MQTFHSFIKKSCIFFLILTIASITISVSYMRRHDISLSAFVDEYGYIVQNQNTSYLSDNMASAIFSSDRSSDYPTRTIEKSDTFSLPTEIFITSDIEKISFVEENRTDLLVEYFREIPDTNKYQVNYEAHLENSQLYISSSSSANNLAITQNYNGSIRIHIPTNTHFDKLSFESNAALVTDSNIYTNTDVLSIMADLGDIDLTVENALDSLYIRCDLGSVSLNTKEDIEQLDVESEFGSVDLTLNGKLALLNIEEDLGDIDLLTTQPIDKIFITTELGNIDAYLHGGVDAINVSTSLGAIDVTLPPTTASIYASTSLGDVDSEFPLTDNDTSNYSFVSDLGSIRIFKQ